MDAPEAAAHTAWMRAAPLRAAPVAVLATVLLWGVAACGERAAPGPVAWQARWRVVREQVPPAAAFRVEDPRPLCGRALRDLKAARGRLQPAPTDVLDHAVGAWLDFAEAMMFDCPVREGPHAGFEAGFVELERLASQVDAALAYGGEPPPR